MSWASLIFIVSGFQGLSHEECIPGVNTAAVVKIRSLFILSSQARTWFGQHGFDDVKVAAIRFSILGWEITGIERQAGKIEDSCETARRNS
jgi:hypothetical protein